jgi:tetratricopeptide (TPR) repeat protein
MLIAVVVLSGLAIVLWFAPLSLKGNTKAQSFFAQGNRLAERGDYDMAAAEWEQAVRTDPKLIEAWVLLGEYYFGRERFEDAIRCMSQVVERAPETPDCHGRLAIAFLSVRSELAAFEEAEKELKRNPKHIPSLAVVASLAGSGGMGEKQLTALEQLVQLLPEDADFLEKYCQSLLERKRDAEAGVYIDRFVRLAPNSHLAPTYQGILAYRLDASREGSQKAIAHFKRALEMEPQALFPRLYLGKLYLRIRDTKQAVAILEDAAKKMPRKMDIQFELANAYTQAKQPAKAKLAQGRFEALRKDNDKMRGLMKRCAVDPKNGALFKETGLFSLSIGNTMNARVYLDHADKLTPGDPQIEAAWKKLEKLETNRQLLMQKLSAMRTAPQSAAGGSR